MCVLLVEDDALVREMTSEFLRDAGHDVFEAENGDRALAELMRTPGRFSILVTDFHMPGTLNGSQVAAKVRQISPGLPVIIATGRPDVLQARWRADLGYMILQKPYRPSQLVAMVESALRPPGS